MYTILHGGIEPLIYGIIISLGLMITIHKFRSGKLRAGLVDVGVFALVFWMHGGTIVGGMSAAVAALICGALVPRIIFRRRR
jgi:hypothetical protein